MTFEIENKVVLVTGASSGLGWEFCLDLAKAGCRIIAAARRIERLKSLCHEINSKSTSGGDQAVAVELDLRANGTLIEAAVHKAWDAFGRIDVLINNAGVRGRVHTPFNLSEDEWNDVIRTNLTGTWLVSKFVCARMRDAKIGGSVINISSIIGTERGFQLGGLVYACSKAAVNTMTKVMALEYGKYKIKVNAISPGIFRSEITEGLLEKDWIRNFQQKTVPLKTFGTSDPALTSLVRYLIEDSSAHVSGNIFMVDAGASLVGFPIFSSL